VKRLVLLGAGAAHLHALQSFARERVAAAELTWVAPAAQWFCPPMLAGCVAGRYRATDCQLPLAPLAAAAGARFVEATVASLELAARRVHLASGAVLDYDVLSLDSGAAIDRDRIPGAREHALCVRPVGLFVDLLERLLDLAARRALDVVVIGGGQLAVEMAFALEQRIGGGDAGSRIVLAAGRAGVLPGAAPKLVGRVLKRLAARRITVFADDAVRIDAQAVHLAGGARLACDAPVLADLIPLPPWQRDSGLALGEGGLVETLRTLQSASHAEVFAAGAARRGGDLLAQNLRRALGGGQLVQQVLGTRGLRLIAEGDRRAIAAWRDWSAEGAWVGLWKERRDRAFLARGRLTRSA
jgi:NADH dehydrogenase FAD-containing subunit